MQPQEPTPDHPPATAPEMGFAEELRSVWRQVPDKGIFFSLLAVWLLLFHFLGNSTFGYINTSSLLRWMYKAYTLDTPIADDEHAVLIPFVVLMLLWWKRKELMAVNWRPWMPGLLLLAAALALHIIGYAVQQTRLSIIALLTGIYALTGVAWGPAFLRASLFPFFLFAFMVPLGSLTEPVTFPLRMLVTKMVSWICHYLLAMDVVCQGTQLSNALGTFQYDVAPACSGIRSVVAIAAMAIIYGFTIFPWGWSRLAILASAIPLAIIGNTFRMMVIVLAAEFGGQAAGNKAHESGFWSMLPYLPAIGGLMYLGRLLERIQKRNAIVTPDKQDSKTA